MERWEINEIIQQYYQGNTTLKEEQRLREYFKSAENIPAEWQACKTMLQFFERENGDKAPGKEPKIQRKKGFLMKKIRLGAAAVVLALIAASALYLNKSVLINEKKNTNSALSSSKIKNTQELFQEMKKSVVEGKENLNLRRHLSSRE